LSPVGVNTSLANLAGETAGTGDFASSLRQLQKIHGQEYAGVQELNRAEISTLLTNMHDVSGSRRVGGTPSDAYLAAHFANSAGLSSPQVDRAEALEDWPQAVALLQQVLAVADKQPEGPGIAKLERERAILPRLSIDMALDGQMDQARAIVAGLPSDCSNCLFAKAAVAALAGDIAAAKRLLAQVDAARPNSPFPDDTFATILLRRGDNEGALDFANRAIMKGPRFPDALKTRGDALRKLNRLDDAVKSYAQAAQGAPRWGRLQIDWGFAEMRRGHWPDARRHLAVAATMDLNAADRRLLARLQQIASAR
jgi:tetratricopeptide (TPR) repeat protein